MQSGRIYSYDILKFFAIIAIAIMHLHWQSAPQAYIGVELCFIITGFFIAKGYDKYLSSDFFSTLINRIKTFYPHFAIAVSFLICIKGFNFSYFILSLLFLPYIGLVKPGIYLGALWFLGAYIVAFAFYICLLKIFDKNKLPYIIGVFVFVMLLAMLKTSPAMNINMSLEKESYIGFLPFGTARALVGMGIGYMVNVLSNKYHTNPFQKYSTAIEFICIFYLSYIILHHATAKFDILCYFIISILLFSLSYKNSTISKILETIGQKYKDLFTLSIYIYIYHGLIIICAKDYLYSHFNMHNSYILIYLVSVLAISFMMRFLYTNAVVIVNNCISGQR